MDILQRQKNFNDDFSGWYDGFFREIVEDNRRRYRMELEDEDDRKERGLSALPSTKSTATVDRSVERAIQEYHADPDAISFTGQIGAGPIVDQKAAWLTEIFKYRSEHTFPFALWHISSLTASFVDGIECALVSWRKEAYKEKEKKYYVYDLELGPQPITEEQYEEIKSIAPDMVAEAEEEVERVVRDTWWIDQLKPGDDVLWDVKAPLLDINLGTACLVKTQKTIDEILNLAENGLIDKVKRDDLVEYQKPETDGYDDSTTVGDTGKEDLGDYNRIPLWIWFEKNNNKWEVSFSIEGEKELSKPKDLNKVWYNGRRVDRLPVVVGTTKLKLWENVGRGLPETIAPIEDEWIDHRNNLNDSAKFAIQGRWRVNKSADIDLDALLNSRVFYSNPGEAEMVQMPDIGQSLRAADSVASDINELVPAGMESKQIVPKGYDKTLGALENALSSSNEKMGVSLLVRNITFLKPLMSLIAELEFAFETDEVIMKAAAGNVKDFQMPMAGDVIDFNALDFGFDVKINAGLGTQDKQTKVRIIHSIATLMAQAGLPVDIEKISGQISVLSGFTADYFLLPEEKRNQEPPGPEMEATINIDLALLPDNMKQMVLDAFLQNSSKVKAKVKGDIPNEVKEAATAVSGSTPFIEQSPLGGQDIGNMGPY